MLQVSRAPLLLLIIFVINGVSVHMEIQNQILLAEITEFAETLGMPKIGNGSLPANATVEFKAGCNAETVGMNFTEFAAYYGLDVQQHPVETADGYILNLFRIPGNGTTVFVMHGLLGSADDFIVQGKGKSLASLMAAENYDVWFGNARGNKYSLGHVNVSADSSEYWDFSWDEIGRRDLPVSIDYVLGETGQSQLVYVGYSQGTTSFFVMCSELPEYNDKVSYMIALAPVSWVHHFKGVLMHVLARFDKAIASVLGPEVFPADSSIVALKNLVCVESEKVILQALCMNTVFLVMGFHEAQLDYSNLPTVLSTIPSSASTKQLLHYAQLLKIKYFKQYDYGPQQNVEKYGSLTPPVYTVSNIKVPMTLFHAANDWANALPDFQTLQKNLSNNYTVYNITNPNFTHTDYVYAKDVKMLVYDKLLEILKSL